MSYPGSWKKVDTNKWENAVTNDKFEIRKTKSVQGVTQSWKGYYNGNLVFELSSRSKKDTAIKAAKREMGKRTRKELTEKKKRKKRLLAALKQARETAKNRSNRAVKLDKNMFNEQHYDWGKPEDVEKWAKNPGSGDLENFDNPIGDDRGKEYTVKMLNRRIEGVEKSLQKDKYQF